MAKPRLPLGESLTSPPHKRRASPLQPPGAPAKKKREHAATKGEPRSAARRALVWPRAAFRRLVTAGKPKSLRVRAAVLDRVQMGFETAAQLFFRSVETALAARTPPRRTILDRDADAAVKEKDWRFLIAGFNKHRELQGLLDEARAAAADVVAAARVAAGGAQGASEAEADYDDGEVTIRQAVANACYNDQESELAQSQAQN